VHWPATPRSFKDCPIYLFKAHAASEEFDVLRPMNSKGATVKATLLEKILPWQYSLINEKNLQERYVHKAELKKTRGTRIFASLKDRSAPSTRMPPPKRTFSLGKESNLHGIQIGLIPPELASLTANILKLLLEGITSGSLATRYAYLCVSIVT
jgi:hypothetical protein